jgi:hypothetical protein
MNGHLSEALDALIAAIGLPDTIRLIEALGGTRWHVPKALPADHPWIGVLGAETAGKLRDAFDGETGLRIPRDKRVLDGLIYRDYEAGMSQNALAIQYRLDVRSVQNALARHRARQAEAGQGDLFGGLGA